MTARPDEEYYRRQYLHWILAELEARFSQRRVEILDLGCGQGRLSVPLAEWCASGGGRVLGVDLTPAAIARAEQNATARGLSNTTFRIFDLLPFLRTLADSSADVVLLIEVTFFLPCCRDVLREVARVMGPTGILFVAFRSQYYNVLQTVRARMWQGARMALEQREGHLFGGPTWFTWQTPEDVREMLAAAGLQARSLRGIGVCSGVEGDPLASVARPSQLSAGEQEQLLRIECAMAEPYAQCGRYMLATVEWLNS